MRFTSSRPQGLFIIAGAGLLLSIGLIIALWYVRNWLPVGTMRLLGGMVGLLNIAVLLAFSMGVLGVIERRKTAVGDQSPAARPGGADLPLTLHSKRMRSLMPMFDFTAEDLAANRRGQLTPRQQRRLRSIANGWIMGATFFMGIFIIIVLKIAFATARPLDIAWLALAVPAIFAVYAAFSIRKLRVAEIHIAEGLVSHHTIENRGGKGPRITHMMCLGDAEFYFPPEERDCFKQGEPYRIYYTGTSTMPIIFSVEALRPDDQPRVLVRVKPWCPAEEYQAARRDSRV